MPTYRSHGVGKLKKGFLRPFLQLPALVGNSDGNDSFFYALMGFPLEKRQRFPFCSPSEQERFW
ncbi:MAG: hypothetical protein ACYCYO_13080 [Bacilli bacterium]